MMVKSVEYYMSLPYTIELQRDPEGGWFVQVKELPGCMSQGETAAEAIEMIEDAMRGWIEVSLEDGDPIPEPRPLDDYSGKFVVRVPKSLHRDLVEAAEREGVSLNQYINVSLAKAVARVMGLPGTALLVRPQAIAGEPLLPVSQSAGIVHENASDYRPGREGAETTPGTGPAPELEP